MTHNLEWLTKSSLIINNSILYLANFANTLYGVFTGEHTRYGMVIYEQGGVHW